MNKIDLRKITEDIKYVLFFLYILLTYMFGENVEMLKYATIVLLMFSGLHSLTILRRNKLKYCVPLITLIVFSFYCFLSSFWAIDSNVALAKSKTLISLVVFFGISYDYFINNNNSIEKILKAVMWAGILFSIYVIMFYGIAGYFEKLINGERVGEEINNVNTIGIQAIISCIIAVFYVVYFGKKRYILYAIIPLIVSLGTGSRKVLFAIIFSSILLVIFNKNESKTISNKLKRTIIYACIVIVFINIIKLPFFETIINRSNKLVDFFDDSKNNTDTSAILREKFIDAGIRSFKEHPFLGIGIANSEYLTFEVNGERTYLHNNFVELLATVGLVGFCLFYYIYVYILINCIKMIKLKNKFINLTFIICLTNLILDYGAVTYYTKKTYVFFLIGIVTIDILKEKNNEKSTEIYKESI